MNYQEARDAIFGAFHAIWQDADEGPLTVLSYTPEVRWQHIDYATKPALHLHYVEVSIKTTRDDQTTFRGPLQKGKKKTKRGIVYVDYFFSRSTGYSQQMSDLPEVGEKAFAAPVGTGNCIWFRNVVSKELPDMEQRYRSRTTATFEYDRIVNPIEEESSPEE